MKQIKGFILGIVFAITLMSVPAIAETVEKTISVLTDYVTVQIDGETKNVRNFVHEGTTYIALRDVSELLGYNVGWDDTTHVASIESKEYTNANKAAITVDGKVITVEKVKALFKRAKAYSSQMGISKSDAEILKELQEELVVTEVMLKKATELNAVDINKVRSDAEAELTAMEMMYGKEMVSQLLSNSGYTREDYIEEYVLQIVNQELLNYLEKNNPEYKALADGAEKYYADNKENYRKPAAQVKHILIPTKDLSTGASLSEEEIIVAKKLADDIYKKATAENFDELIKEYGNDPGQTDEGYYVSENSDFVPQFEETALSLTKKGQIAKPVETSYGYHIIMATEIYEYLPYEMFLPQYISEKYSELNQKIIKEWLNEAEIVYSQEPIENLIK